MPEFKCRRRPSGIRTGEANSVGPLYALCVEGPPSWGGRWAVYFHPGLNKDFSVFGPMAAYLFGVSDGDSKVLHARSATHRHSFDATVDRVSNEPEYPAARIFLASIDLAGYFSFSDGDPLPSVREVSLHAIDEVRCIPTTLEGAGVVLGA